MIGIMVCAIAIYLALILSQMIVACMDQYPREYRDAANSVIALDIANGVNPYITMEQDVSPVIYVYTSLNILIAAVIYKLTGTTIYTIFHCLDFIYLCMSTLLIYEIIRRKTKSKLLGFISLPLSFTLGYRYCFIQACPDRLGILILIIVKRDVWHKGEWMKTLQ